MPSARQPILLEVLAHVPTDFFHFAYCERLFDAAEVSAPIHQDIQAAYPPEIVEQAERLFTWLQGLSAQYGNHLHIHMVNPQSVEGFFKSLRYWIHQYPAFIVNRREKIVGWNPADVERLLADEIVQQRRDVMASARQRILSQLRCAAHAAGEFLYGMTTYDWVRDMCRERGEAERLFVLITFGDIVGIPILPPYYTLRLLPYVVPVVNRWKRSLLRERDLTDLAGLIEGIT